MYYNQNQEDIYVFTSKDIKTIRVKNEGQDVWKLLLDIGKTKEAYEICNKTNSPHTQYVTICYLKRYTYHISIFNSSLDCMLMNSTKIRNTKKLHKNTAYRIEVLKK